MIRDIFMANSDRGGCFSVKSKCVADKLITSILNNNVSCRGRKPHAQLIPISAENSRLRLSNLNAVICKSDFVAWCKTLHCDAFDLHLFPTLISEPFPTHMIVAFDTIDAAIAVKQKLSNAPFRGCTLYFTHWHVPRRSQYPEVRPGKSVGTPSWSAATSVASAAASPTNQSAHSLHMLDRQSSSGYSISTRTNVTATPLSLRSPQHSNNSSNGSGPLYLRDASVPAPPRRVPPQPPVYRVRVDINIGDDIDAHVTHGQAKAVIQAAAHSQAQSQRQTETQMVDTIGVVGVVVGEVEDLATLIMEDKVSAQSKPASSTPSTETSSSQTSCLPKSQSSCSDLEDGLDEDKDKDGQQEKDTLEALEALIDEEVSRYPFDYADEMLMGGGHGKLEQPSSLPPQQQQQQQPPSNTNNTQYVHSLQTELDSHKLYVHHLERMNKYYVEQLNALKVQQQGMGEKYEYLYRQYAGMKRCNAVLAWNTHEIVQWILQLESGRFYKYKTNLVALTQHYQINGAMLSRFKLAELYKMGIADSNDQHSLLRHIQTLFAMS